MRGFIHLLLFCFLCTYAEATDAPLRAKICLNMIVKDESSIICRCLASTLPLIDYWVIVDTGSTDGTQTVIKEFMQKNKIPGELHERPWLNFGHNRNEALDLARSKGDYVLFIDADNYLEFDKDFKLPSLEKDCYHIMLSQSGSRYSRVSLINTRLPWKWVGVLHEVVCCPNTTSEATLDKVTQIVLTDGARSKDPKKYEKDAAIFEAALKEDPDNSRYVFYLAQSYYDAENYPLALKNYERRVGMGGWDQEVFWSLFRVASLQEQLKMAYKTVINGYKNAYQYRNSRIEPLYYLANYYRMQNDFKSGYEVASLAQLEAQTTDNLFVQQWIYDYGLALERSVCAYWIGKYEECQQISRTLLARDLPPDIRTIVERNLGFANNQILEKITQQ